jgi:putative methanogenesis marker protein 8
MPQENEQICNRTCGTHEIYCCGSKVRISHKGVLALTEPVVKHCPLHESMYGTKEIDAVSVEKSVERKIAECGFCCRNRRFDAAPMVAYGASEMMSVWLHKKLVDCAVVVCEGAGTVITGNGKLVQGIGARLTGIIKTSPIREVIEEIQENGGVVLDEASARIDQLEGVKRAFDLGFRRVAVTVASFQAKAISQIRSLQAVRKNIVIIFSVCNTLAKKGDVKQIAKADVACASASTILREVIGSKALLQVGITIPVYALTQIGKELVLAYLTAFKDKLVIFRTDKLPYEANNKGPKLREPSPDKRLEA